MHLTLSENISRLRRAQGMTQEQLAEALGVTFASVSKWERGLATPELKLIAEMADLFSVSLDALVGFELQNGSAAALEARIHDGQRQKQYASAIAEAEKALLRYPNDFRIAYRSAELYAVAGMERHSAPHLRRAIALWERSIALLSQNADPRVSEVSIQKEIAQCHIALGQPQRGIEILKRTNVSGIHSAEIAFALTGPDLPGVRAPQGRLEEAVPYMAEAFVSMIAQSVRTLLACANYYYKRGQYAACREALLWLIDLLERVKLDPDAPCFVDKVIAPCYCACAQCALRLGETAEVEPLMKRAHRAALRFDSAPTCAVENLKFCIGGMAGATAYDDIGESASDAVLRQIAQEEQDAPLRPIWDSIVREEPPGGAE